MEQWFTANEYVILTIEITDLVNITTDVKCFKHRKDARRYFTMLQDLLIADIAQKHNIPFNEFDINEFGSLTVTDNIINFEDFDGECQIRHELKTI